MHCITLPGPGFEPGLLRPQRSVLTTRRSRLRGLTQRKSAQVNIAAGDIKGKKSKIPLHYIAGTRIRAWVTAATTQCPNH